MDDSGIICDEVIDADADPKAKSNDEANSYDQTKTILINFNKKKASCKMQTFYILLALLLITIALLIAGSIYCYLIKYRAKKLLPFHYTNNELEKFYINKCFINMSNKDKGIHIKNRTYYFFNDIIKIKNFDPNNIKIDEKSYKIILIYYIEYVTIKDSK